MLYKSLMLFIRQEWLSTQPAAKPDLSAIDNAAEIVHQDNIYGLYFCITFLLCSSHFLKREHEKFRPFTERKYMLE